MCRLMFFLVSTTLSVLAIPAHSQTTAYKYDAVGRLIQAQQPTSDAVITYDTNGNRVYYSVTIGSSGPSNCTFVTSPDVGSDDEFSVFAYLKRTGTCSSPVSYGYTVDYVSGSGNYSVAPFGPQGPFSPADSSNDGIYRYIRISPYYGSIPSNSCLVLRVTWTSSATEANISPNGTLVSFCSS